MTFFIPNRDGSKVLGHAQFVVVTFVKVLAPSQRKKLKDVPIFCYLN